MKAFKEQSRIAALIFVLLLAGCGKQSESGKTSVGSEEAHQHQQPVATASAPATTSAPAAKGKEEKVHLMHVHGLSYAPDGGRILIPSHHGLAVYEGGNWSVAPGPRHDYMGFSATKNALYSSGHPAPGSGLVNPFGVIKSTDGGQTWQKLGFEGESDFHLLATGYESGGVYVINPHPNSKMKEQGLYFTLNDGFSWQHPAAKGLRGEPLALAAHPTDAKTIAIGSENGLYLSRNGGESFDLVHQGAVAGVFFDLNGKHLWYSHVAGQPALHKLNLSSRDTQQVALPELQKDAVAYIAQNPVRRQEYAIATFKRSVYISEDEGKTWKQLATQGETN